MSALLSGSTPSSCPTPTPCVHVDIHTPVAFLIVLQAAASHSLADSALGDPEPAGCFLDGETVYPVSIPFVHIGILCLLDTASGEVMEEAAHHPRGLQATLRLRAAHAHSRRGWHPLPLGEQGA